MQRSIDRWYLATCSGTPEFLSFIAPQRSPEDQQHHNRHDRKAVYPCAEAEHWIVGGVDCSNEKAEKAVVQGVQEGGQPDATSLTPRTPKQGRMCVDNHQDRPSMG